VAGHWKAEMSLHEEISALQKNMADRIPEYVTGMMRDATEMLAQSGLIEQALKAGDRMPDFDLPALGDGQIRSCDILKESSLVISFYRGGWCPYCNLEMQALQRSLPDIEQAGGQLIAITPELPEFAERTRDKGNLTFSILHDRDNAVAKAFGLVFTLPDMLRPVYEGFGIDLEESQGNDHFELPVPATYIVRPDSVIAFGYVDVDYTQRMEPDSIVKILKTL